MTPSAISKLTNLNQNLAQKMIAYANARDPSAKNKLINDALLDYKKEMMELGEIYNDDNVDIRQLIQNVEGQYKFFNDELEGLNKYVEQKLVPIYDVLGQLEAKLDEPTTYNSPNTKITAQAIFQDLVVAADAYKKALLDAKGDKTEENKAIKQFKSDCSEALTKDGRKQQLEKDISWSDFFKDLLKMSANAAITLPNFFRTNKITFYQYAKPGDSAELVETTKTNLITSLKVPHEI